MSNQLRYVMWALNVRSHGFRDRLDAAAAGRFDVLTVKLRDYRRDRLIGTQPQEMLSAAEDAGVSLDFLDGMTSWAPIRYPPTCPSFVKDSWNFSSDDAFAMCDELRLKHIVAVAGFETEALPHAMLIDYFGKFCERAAQREIWVDLEPMPMTGLPTLRHAWDIVRDVGCSNSGVLIDTWHFFRGEPDFELLSTIPRGRIANLQIVDALRARLEDLWEDVQKRELPGVGELPLQTVVSLLKETQDLCSVGPEAMNPRVDGMSPRDIGMAARSAIDAAMH